MSGIRENEGLILAGLALISWKKEPNRLQDSLHLFSNGSQITSKDISAISLMFLSHFGVFYDLLLNRRTNGKMESVCFLEHDIVNMVINVIFAPGTNRNAV